MSNPAQPQPLYTVRDSAGNIYGPAAVPLLRQWIAEGRIVAGMLIAPRGTSHWSDVASHPDLADLFQNPFPSATTTDALVPLDSAPNPYAQTAPLSQSSYPAPYNPNAPVAYQTAGTARQNPIGLASFICGCVGLPIMCCPFLCIGPMVGSLLAIVAVVLGCIALSQIKADPAAYTGKGLAIGGIALGGTVLLIELVLLVFFLVVLLINAKP